jgi:hypothetical protein
MNDPQQIALGALSYILLTCTSADEQHSAIVRTAGLLVPAASGELFVWRAQDEERPTAVAHWDVAPDEGAAQGGEGRLSVGVPLLGERGALGMLVARPWQAQSPTELTGLRHLLTAIAEVAGPPMQALADRTSVPLQAEDPLTGCPYWHGPALSLDASLYQPAGRPAGVLLIALEVSGPAELGQRAQAVTRLIKAGLGPQAALFALGEGVLLAVLPKANGAEAAARAERVRRAVQAWVQQGGDGAGPALRVTIGAAGLAGPETAFCAAVVAAAEALACAQYAGGDQVVLGAAD